MKENLNKVIKHKKLLLFAGGAITAIAAKKILESDETKNFVLRHLLK
ncbi:hypothetical protein [Methanobrevibacter arboriphilus]|nr:hypothetical protein [Methanobrevibacter arboriphilus]